MARYEVRFKRSVAKDLRTIPKSDVKRILATVESIARDPRGAGCKKLSARNFYRARQGAYRIIYEVFDDHLVVQVVRVAHRSKVYR